MNEYISEKLKGYTEILEAIYINDVLISVERLPRQSCQSIQRQNWNLRLLIICKHFFLNLEQGK